VRIVLEGTDKFNNLIGSVYYNDGNEAKNLALELVTNVSKGIFGLLNFLLTH